MHNEASVSDESACARNQIGIGVGVGSSVACAVEFAVLAAKIAHLACRWGGGVTGSVLSTQIRVEMCQSSRAVTVCWHRLIMNVIHCNNVRDRGPIQVTSVSY